MKADLFNDIHPETTLKTTGFANPKIAYQTINIIKKRSLKYQFDIINTMINRAKYHPYKNKDMDKVINIYQKWLNNYQSKKELEDYKYKKINIELINQYEAILYKYDIDKINRKFKINIRELIHIYKNNKPHKLYYLLVDKNKPDYYDYYSYRIMLIKKIIKYIKNNNIDLYYKKGSLKDFPKKEYLIILLLGYYIK